ncbi:MAG TPA: hypothetical protein VMI11_13080 [Actinomycetes bacterium]|nr:hypothetical protein [Actinomycetes bacterium]
MTLLRLTEKVRLAWRGRRDERGDVPGWVLITVMTAGLVSGLWVLAGPKLGEIFSNAMDSVTGP